MPGILPCPLVLVAEQGQRALRGDKAVENPQGGGPVHPVERPAHGDEIERAERGRQVVGTALSEVDLHAGLRGLDPGCRQHRGIRIEPDHRAAGLRESDGEKARPAAEVEHPPAGRQRHAAGHLVDEARGIAQAIGAIERDGGAEPVGFERRDIRHRAGSHARMAAESVPAGGEALLRAALRRR